MKQPTIKRAEQRADLALSAYIRERDGWKCFTCDRIGNKYNMDAGHLFSRRYTFIKYNELNVHCQCVYCNKYLGGNANEYHHRFIEMYGYQRYNQLYADKNNYVKKTVDFYLRHEQYYKYKLEELRKVHNV